jgi:hypothetical protein
MRSTCEQGCCMVHRGAYNALLAQFNDYALSCTSRSALGFAIHAQIKASSTFSLRRGELRKRGGRGSKAGNQLVTGHRHRRHRRGLARRADSSRPRPRARAQTQTTDDRRQTRGGSKNKRLKRETDVHLRQLAKKSTYVPSLFFVLCSFFGSRP